MTTPSPATAHASILVEAVVLARDALGGLARAPRRVLRAVLVPYVTAVGIMVIGCPLGIPGRFPFDLAHVALEIAFATAVARIVAGNGAGPRFAGLALPRPAWPGVADALRIAGAVVVLLIPAASLVMAYITATAAWVAAQDWIALTVVSRITPAFLMSALIGAVVGAWRARAAWAVALPDRLP